MLRGHSQWIFLSFAPINFSTASSINTVHFSVMNIIGMLCLILKKSVLQRLKLTLERSFKIVKQRHFTENYHCKKILLSSKTIRKDDGPSLVTSTWEDAHAMVDKDSIFSWHSVIIWLTSSFGISSRRAIFILFLLEVVFRWCLIV